MKLGIMQPYFFPYIGYFQLIQAVDRFILFDDVQYIRHGWINRNRMLKPGEGVQYIVAPLQKHHQKEEIKSIRLQEGEDWKSKLLRQLHHYKKPAKHYTQTMALLEACMAVTEVNITRFNAKCLQLVHEHLGLSFTIEISSEMNFDYSNVNDAGEWALRIAEQTKASEYINPAGGSELFDAAKFNRVAIKLSFISPNIVPYDQRRGTFEPALSIIDVLMFNGVDATRKMIRPVF